MFISWLSVHDLKLDEKKMRAMAESTKFNIEEVNTEVPQVAPPNTIEDVFHSKNTDAGDVDGMFNRLFTHIFYKTVINFNHFHVQLLWK